jgi:hypothetical protein
MVEFFSLPGKEKKGNMKKIFAILIMAVILTGCYEEFRNDYPYTTVAFSTATGGLSTAGELGRTVVKGEGLKLDIGVYLAGVLENREDILVRYTLDPSLLAGTAYELMPADYYTFSDINQMIIPEGEYIGRLTITLDSARFLADPDAVNFHYAIPLRLTETSADSINASLATKILVVKFITRVEGFYNHTGTYTTYEEGGTEMGSGAMTSVISAQTISLDSISANGILHLYGAGYTMNYRIHPDNTVTWKKLPNPPPTQVNLATEYPPAVTTDYVSGWETLSAVNDGKVPASSTNDYTYPKFGNWYSGNDWGWIQYTFSRPYRISASNVFWWSDEGGLLFPTDQYVEYHNMATDTWEEVPNPVGYGAEPDKFNVTRFDEITTDGIRLNFINSSESVGISEWQVMGIGDPMTPEERPIANVLPNGTSTWDPATSTLTLNYKVIYEEATYYTNASSKLVWRNRIRDGVNEWRR